MSTPGHQARPYANLNRTEFPQYCSVISGGTMIYPVGALETHPDVRSGNSCWYHRPLRVLQSVLRETDAIDYHAASALKAAE